MESNDSPEIADGGGGDIRHPQPPFRGLLNNKTGPEKNSKTGQDEQQSWTRQGQHTRTGQEQQNWTRQQQKTKQNCVVSLTGHWAKINKTGPEKNSTTRRDEQQRWSRQEQQTQTSQEQQNRTSKEQQNRTSQEQ